MLKFKDTATIDFEFYNMGKRNGKIVWRNYQDIKKSFVNEWGENKSIGNDNICHDKVWDSKFKQISKHLKTNAKQESSYKRLQRFIKEVSFEGMRLARLLLVFTDVGANEN